MFDWKAIPAGMIVTIVLWLIGQLIYVLAASAIGLASSSHMEMDFFATYKEQLWFVAAMIVYCLTMIVGGLITAYLCNNHFVPNASMACGLTGCFIVVTSLGIGQLTYMSLMLPLLGFGFGALGGFAWQKYFLKNH